MHPDYGFDKENRPAVCMGFKLTEEHRPGSDSRYDLDLMFNDLPPDQIRGIPQ